MPNPPKKGRNLRMLKAWQRGGSYRKIARDFRLKSPATVHEIVQRELAKRAA